MWRNSKKKDKGNSNRQIERVPSFQVIPDFRDEYEDEQKFLVEFAKNLADREWTSNIDNLMAWRSKVKKKDELYQKRDWQDLSQEILKLNGEAQGLCNEWKKRAADGKENERFLYGDPVTGDLTNEELDHYLRCEADFAKIKKILDERSWVIEALQPLATELITTALLRGKPTYQRLNTVLLELLAKYERKVGFTSVAVPLGILEANTFLELLNKGTILDDFGAGIVHGELTHRLQWHAIARFMTDDFRKLNGPAPGWNFTVLDIYKQMNSAPFSASRTNAGATKWGSLLDRGVTSTLTSYGFPGTFHRDLLEAGARGHQGLLHFAMRCMTLKEALEAWPKRDVDRSLQPELWGLEPIGCALLYQIRRRFADAGDRNQAYDQTGLHPEEVASALVRQLNEAGFIENAGCLWAPPPKDEQSIEE